MFPFRVLNSQYNQVDLCFEFLRKYTLYRHLADSSPSGFHHQSPHNALFEFPETSTSGISRFVPFHILQFIGRCKVISDVRVIASSILFKLCLSSKKKIRTFLAERNDMGKKCLDYNKWVNICIFNTPHFFVSPAITLSCLWETNYR